MHHHTFVVYPYAHQIISILTYIQVVPWVIWFWKTVVFIRYCPYNSTFLLFWKCFHFFLKNPPKLKPKIQSRLIACIGVFLCILSIYLILLLASSFIWRAIFRSHMCSNCLHYSVQQFLSQINSLVTKTPLNVQILLIYLYYIPMPDIANSKWADFTSSLLDINSICSKARILAQIRVLRTLRESLFSHAQSSSCFSWNG